MNDNKKNSQGKEQKKMSMYIFPLRLFCLMWARRLCALSARTINALYIGSLLRCSMLR